MTNEELAHLKKTVSVANPALMYDLIWIGAFSEYNKENKEQLYMFIMPNYRTVLQWHLNKKHEVTV